MANLAILVASWALSHLGPDLTRRWSLDLIDAVDNFGGPIAPALVGLVQLVAILVPVGAAIGLVARRRLDLLALFSLSALVAAVVMVMWTGRLQTDIALEDLGFHRVDS